MASAQSYSHYCQAVVPGTNNEITANWISALNSTNATRICYCGAHNKQLVCGWIHCLALADLERQAGSKGQVGTTPTALGIAQLSE